MASQTISGASAVAKVLRAARRLEDQAAAAAVEDTYDFLATYSLKLIGCNAGVAVQDPETLEEEYSSVIFRLCPTEKGCSSSTMSGCKKGYGDFVVGLNTFVEAYFEDQRDNMNADDQFDVNRYRDCTQYNVEKNDNNAEEEQVQYYIGPGCTKGGTGVKLGLYTDATCTTATSTAFADISNGGTLPYADGGLVSTYCTDCTETDDQGATGLRQMCQNLYASSAYACEKSMTSVAYSGQKVEGCSYISSTMPKAVKKSMRGGAVFGWIVFAFLIAGFGAYIVWWRKKKQSQALMSS